MKRFIIVFIGIFIVGNSNLLFSSNAMEYNKAMQYLEERGEVCFTFYVNSALEIGTLTNMISIDKVTNATEVFAYANKDEFNEFIKQNYYYEVQTPPSLLVDVAMSDYADYLKGNAPPEWDRYPTYPAYEEIMDKFAADYPDLCIIEQFGTSVQDRKLLAAKVTDNVNEEEKEPKFFYQATIHGDETGPYVFMLNLIEYLLSSYGRDARVTNLVDNIEIWINPLCNPDGTYKGGNSSVQGATRANASGQDLNRDFPSVNLSGERDLRQDRRQPETEATIDFGDKYPFSMSGDFHAGAELVCYIWGMSSTNHADQQWWEYVGQEWADLAQENSPSGYFTGTGDGCINAYDWYAVQGERMNYAAYNQQCRSLTIEVSSRKIMSEGDLSDHWGYLKESILTYLEQQLYGIQGTVTDTNTGEPLEAMVFIEGHDKHNSHVYSHLPNGDFYRPIAEGTYEVTFTCGDYHPKTVSGVKVEDYQATILEVELWDGTTGTNVNPPNSMNGISVLSHNRGVTITCNTKGTVKAAIYDVNGRLVRQLSAASGMQSVVWDGTDNTGHSISNGCYIVKVKTDKQAFAKNFILHR